MLGIFKKRPRGKEDYIKVSPSGQLYIETKDFFAQMEVRGTIEKLLNSELVKEIDRKKKNKF